jgi:hypothetical protein
MAVFGGALSAVLEGSKAGCLALSCGILLALAFMGLVSLVGTGWLD